MDQKYFGKAKAADLRAELDLARKKLRPQQRVKMVLKKFVSNIILNRQELAGLMSDVVRLMVIDDYEIRRLCCHYIVHYAELNAESVEALDFLKRFLQDLDAMLRALAVRTVSSIPLPPFVDLAMTAIKHALQDVNPHVRTAAAFAVGRIYQHDPKQTLLLLYIEALNDLLYDENQTVVCNALAALNLITETSSTLNLKINKDHSLALVRNVSLANEWHQVYLLNAVMLYVPEKCSDALEVLQTVLPCLQHENLAVVLNAVKVVMYLANYIETPDLVAQGLSKRLGSVVVALLSKPPEIQFLVLRNVILLLLGRKYLISVDVLLFFWNFDDPIYIKDTKLEIIYLLADENNIDVVFRELEEYATEVDVNMARKAIRAFGNLSIKLNAAATRCVDILLDLLSNGISYVVHEAAVVLKNILRKYPGRYDFAIESLSRHYRMVEEPDAKAAIVWMVGQYPDKIPNVDEVLGHFVKTFEEDPLEVQYALLNTVVKFYVKYPKRGEQFLLTVLKSATEECNNPDLRDHGFFYWRLITHPDNNGTDADFQSKTKEIVIDADSAITADNDNIDPAIIEELELNIGSLASIYLKSVKYVFRLAKRRHLQPSPALQPRVRDHSAEELNRATGEIAEVPDRVITRPEVPAKLPSHKPLPAINEPKFLLLSTENKFSQKLSRTASKLSRKKSFRSTG